MPESPKNAPDPGRVRELARDVMQRRIGETTANDIYWIAETHWPEICGDEALTARQRALLAAVDSEMRAEWQRMTTAVGASDKEWSWASGMFGAVPGVAHFTARCLEEPFGSVELLFKNGFQASVTVNRSRSMVGRYELRVVAPDGEPARPVGLDDAAVIDALSAISARRAVLDFLKPDPEGN